MNDVLRARAEGLAATGAATGPTIRALLAHIDWLEAQVVEAERLRCLCDQAGGDS